MTRTISTNKPETPLSESERRIAETLGVRFPPVTFPIADPDLAALSELLHRMTLCQEDTPATRYAWQAIGLLRAYLLRVSNSDVTR